MESKGHNPLKRLWQALLDTFKGQEQTPPAPPPKSTAPAPSQRSTPTPKPTPAPASTPKTEHHNVGGTSFRREALLALGVKNEDYTKTKRDLIEEGLVGERIYQTDFFCTKVELVPEPDNPEDPNAIKVLADGRHIGYIKKGSCARVHKLLKAGTIEAMRCEIKGGRYKVLLEEVDEDGDPHYTLITEEHPLCADLFLSIKE
jgi:hypothetical protein